jgi:hypothetical protein
MKSQFLKIAGVNSEEEFYQKYPSEEFFFRAHPEAQMMMKSGGNVPTNPSLWSRAKSLAKQKFDVYPSAYANGWAAKWYKGKGGTWRKAEYGMQVMGEGGTNNPGFEALPEYVQAKILSNMQLGGAAVPFSPEFFDQLRNEYNQFYNVKPPYRPIEDDGYDAFFKYKKKNLPEVLYSQGPGWLVKNEDREMFFRGEKGLPMPKNVEKKTGTKTFFEDFKSMNDNPLLMQYADMIDKLVRDKRAGGKAPIQQAFKFQKGGEPDGEMALGQLAAVVDKMNKLRQFIQPDSDLEPWISSKLAVMDHYADAVSDYMMYNPEAQGEEMEMMKRGGYVVTRSNDRKGKTHKVTGPDGTVKYFGDSKLGQHPKDPERKKAFYARHKKNLDGNPYFRAFARATWQDGGEIYEMANGGYIGMDGKRHMSSTPTWSGNAGYETGGPVVGDEMDVTPEQLELLRAQGYEFEII